MKFINYECEFINLNYPNLFYLFPFLSIIFIDFTLCLFFGKKVRWFQLHLIINIVILYLIIEDYFNYLIKFEESYIINDILFKLQPFNYLFLTFNYILSIHIYHFYINPNMSRLEIWHHLQFVLFGVLPCLFFIKSNIAVLWIFPGCSLPGALEYFSLILSKNNKISFLQQKNIASYLKIIFKISSYYNRKYLYF